jgi:hypothetical protein
MLPSSRRKKVCREDEEEKDFITLQSRFIECISVKPIADFPDAPFQSMHPPISKLPPFQETRN